MTTQGSFCLWSPPRQVALLYFTTSDIVHFIHVLSQSRLHAQNALQFELMTLHC